MMAEWLSTQQLEKNSMIEFTVMLDAVYRFYKDKTRELLLFTPNIA